MAKLKPERKLKLRASGVASSAPTPIVFNLMPKAAVRNGLGEGSSFLTRGAGGTWITPSAPSLLTDSYALEREAKLLEVDDRLASCVGSVEFVRIEDVGS